MSLPELIARFVQPLAQLDVSYMVIGGVAGIIYSEPRYTQDLDLLAQLDPAQAGALAAAFPAAEFYVPPIEVIEEEARRRGRPSRLGAEPAPDRHGARATALDIARMLLISADRIDYGELQAKVADHQLGPE